MKGGAAKTYQALEMAIPEFEGAGSAWLSGPGSSAPQTDRDLVQENVREGYVVRRYLLQHLHGEARPDQTPDLMAIKRAFDTYRAWGLNLMSDAGVEPPPSWG